MDEQILRAAKEIVVKFIETGRVSPSSFPEAFKSIYETLRTTVYPIPTEEVSPTAYAESD
jgi:hypothetical protein